MNLSGSDFRKLINSILEAYPNRNDLDMMVKFNLDESLDAIAGGNTTTEIIFNLIKWTSAIGKLKYLLEVLIEDRPDNLDLQATVKELLQRYFLQDIEDKNQVTQDTQLFSEKIHPMNEFQDEYINNDTILQERGQVFISYSHKDKQWLEKLQNMLKPLLRKKTISIWDDTKINVGDRWRDEITTSLYSAKVAVLMVSPNFLASNFIAEQEIPQLLKAAEQEGLTIIWLCISACFYEETEIEEYQAAHDISQPLDSLNPANLNQVLKDICKKIKEVVINTSNTQNSPKDKSSGGNYFYSQVHIENGDIVGHNQIKKQ